MTSPLASHQAPNLRRNRLRRYVLFIATFLFFTSALSARELRVEKFDAQITVLPGGSVDVTENISFRFIGSWRGVYREIPVEYVTPQGRNFSLFLKVKSCTDNA